MKHLFIIHGWAYSVKPWDKTLEYLRNDGIKVTMLHVPGLTEASTKTFTIDDYVKWADQALPDGAIALGHSNGGRILMNLCIKKPRKLSKLILLDSAGIREKNLFRDTLRAASKTMAPMKKIKPLRTFFHKFIGANDYERAPENMKRTMSNLLDSDDYLEPARITTPTAIIWGGDDTITPPRQGQRLHELIHGSTLDIHADWPHAPYINHPRELADAIIKAMEETS